MLEWIAETTLVAAALAIVALLTGRVRSIGPTVRHMLWLVVLIKLLTPPVVSWPWATRSQTLNWPVSLSQGATATTARDGQDLVGSEQPRAKLPRSEPTSATAVVQDVESARPIGVTGVMYVPAAWSTLGVPAIRGRDMPWLRIPRLPTLATVVNSLIVGWLALSFLLTLVQTFRIVRFRRRLRAATPAPDKLLDEARWIGRRLGVSVPELLVIPEIGCPLLWCLGRPRLLLPARLVKTLPLEQWRGILTHELAHLSPWRPLG